MWPFDFWCHYGDRTLRVLPTGVDNALPEEHFLSFFQLVPDDSPNAKGDHGRDHGIKYIPGN